MCDTSGQVNEAVAVCQHCGAAVPRPPGRGPSGQGPDGQEAQGYSPDGLHLRPYEGGSGPSQRRSSRRTRRAGGVTPDVGEIGARDAATRACGPSTSTRCVPPPRRLPPHAKSSRPPRLWRRRPGTVFTRARAQSSTSWRGTQERVILASWHQASRTCPGQARNCDLR